MPRWNYTSRNSSAEPRKSSIEVQQERINKFLDVVFERKEIKRLDLKKALQLGPGSFERIERDVKYDYSDIVEWDKKLKVWKHIPTKFELEKEAIQN